MFKAIQYKTGYKKWTGLERRLLQTHWREFTGHSRLMVQTLRGMVGIQDLSNIVRHFKCNSKTYSCKHLYCDNCHEKFTPYDILELLYCQQTDILLECQELESWIGTCLSKIHPNWIVKFIPWLLQTGKTPAAQRIITNNILPLAINNMHIAYAIYFECEMLKSSSIKTYYIAIQSRLMSIIDHKLREEIKESHKFIKIMEHPKCIETIKPVRLPYDPSVIVKKVYVDKIKQLQTNTRPFVIPLSTSKGDIRILHKDDDLRKDRLVITIMEMLKVIDNRLLLHSYHVFPISCIHGWIEMIPNSKTIYDIKQNTTIQNYILSHNMNLNMTQLRTQFMRSCTSNCVLTYMLGLGDRNLHNILICPQSCSIANIDFSYMLGHDPKNIESTEMKITAGMVDMLGGIHSEYFETLKLTCTQTYANIRKHTYFWYTLLRYLVLSNPPIYPHSGDLKELQKHVDTRLMPNSTDEQMKVAIVKSVETNSDSWNSSISDMSHSIKTTISGLMFQLDL